MKIWVEPFNDSRGRLIQKYLEVSRRLISLIQKYSANTFMLLRQSFIEIGFTRYFIIKGIYFIIIRNQKIPRVCKFWKMIFFLFIFFSINFSKIGPVQIDIKVFLILAFFWFDWCLHHSKHDLVVQKGQRIARRSTGSRIKQDSSYSTIWQK